MTIVQNRSRASCGGRERPGQNCKLRSPPSPWAVGALPSLTSATLQPGATLALYLHEKEEVFASLSSAWHFARRPGAPWASQAAQMGLSVLFPVEAGLERGSLEGTSGDGCWGGRPSLFSWEGCKLLHHRLITVFQSCGSLSRKDSKPLGWPDLELTCTQIPPLRLSSGLKFILLSPVGPGKRPRENERALLEWKV